MITEFRQSRLAPTAPAAASGPRLIANSSVLRSRVKVVRANGTVLGYATPPSRHGHTTVVASADEALVLNIPKVRDEQQKETHIEIVVSSGGISGPQSLRESGVEFRLPPTATAGSHTRL
ncbi:hypothetical protein FRB93_001099 [Tulasnella sp. JGI-2019a]|nr:hypothetical protein FRB93_001099 [Tulasnella sp. JGI-2019a]